jgi:hypothetical protein
MQPSLLYFMLFIGQKTLLSKSPYNNVLVHNYLSIYEVYIPGIGEGEGGVEAAVEAGQEQGSGIEQGTVG